MTNTVAEAIAYARNHPTHNGGDWDGWCEALVHNAGGFTNNFNSARLARLASHVHSPGSLPMSQIPDGWLLWWSYASDDHVGIMTPHGVLMASNYTSSIHDHLGYIDPAHYTSISGNAYLGASPDHGGQYMEGIDRTPGSVTIHKPGRTVATLTTGKPNTAFYKRLQWYGHLNGYDGPIDGALGGGSWAGVQVGLAHYGYTGPADGKPGINTRKALQRMAHKYGSNDAIDGTLSAADYRAIAKRLNLL